MTKTILKLMLPELLNQIPPYIVGGDLYGFEGAYGHNARFIDFESNVEAVFDARTLEVFELSIQDEISPLIWRKPELEEKYLGSVQHLLNLDEQDLDLRRGNVSDIAEMITKVRSHYGIV